MLAFFMNCTPNFPVRDGGCQSRLSYLFMPFEFVAEPRPDSMERKMDINVKTVEAPKLVTEFLYWCVLLSQGLAMGRHDSRVILPRPNKVLEDTRSHFQKDPAVEAAQHIGVEFIEAMCRLALGGWCYKLITHLVPQ